MFGQIVGMLSELFSNLTVWFAYIVDSAGMLDYYIISVFFILLARFILYPLFGSAIWSGASDTVRGVKERNRYHGSYERNMKGKFSK